MVRKFVSISTFGVPNVRLIPPKPVQGRCNGAVKSQVLDHVPTVVSKERRFGTYNRGQGVSRNMTAIGKMEKVYTPPEASW
jgi:hypothetical protein